MVELSEAESVQAGALREGAGWVAMSRVASQAWLSSGRKWMVPIVRRFTMLWGVSCSEVDRCLLYNRDFRRDLAAGAIRLVDRDTPLRPVK